MRRPEQGRGPGQDRLEQLVLAVPVEQAERRLVERPQVRIGLRLDRRGPSARRLGQVQRLVGDRRRGRPWSAVVRVAGDADADGDRRSAASRSTAPRPPARIALGDLVRRRCGRRRAGWPRTRRRRSGRAGRPRGSRPRMARRERGQEGVAGGMAAGVVERLEARRDRASGSRTAGRRRPTASPSSRWNAAVVAQAGQRVAARRGP